MPPQTTIDGMAALGMAARVGDVMRPATTTVEHGAHLAGAAYLMKRHHDSALVVTTDDRERRPIAVLTDGDIAMAVAEGRDLEETRIHHLTSGEPITIAPQVTVIEAIRTMVDHRIHHLPVVDSGRLVGIVDMTDLCRALVSTPAAAS